MTAEKNKRCWM